MSDFTTIPNDKYKELITNLEDVVYSSLSDDHEFANFAWEKARHILSNILGVKYEPKEPCKRDVSDLFEGETD